MIGKAIHGASLGNLVRYLYGPGKAEEHTDQHLVVSWLGREAPDTPGELVPLMTAPMQWAPTTPDKYTYHVPLRNHETDRRLTDDEWAQVGTDLAARLGLDAGDGSPACPWVVIRHADDHVHFAAVKVREDGTVWRPRNDYWAIADTRHVAEARYGLTSTGPTDGTGPARPTRGEVEKAARAGRTAPARTLLRDEVRTAAATSDSPEAFVAALDEVGVDVQLRYSTINDGQITGYSVGWPGDRTADGGQVLYGGSKLAKDLSWPRLTERWARPTAVGDPWKATTAATNAALAELTGNPDATDAVAEAVGEVLDAAAVAQDGRTAGPWRQAAGDFDRARRTRRRPTSTPASRSLHAAARALGRCTRNTGGGDMAAAAVRLSVLLLTLAQQRQQTQRAQAAAGAAIAATRLAPATRDSPSRPPVPPGLRPPHQPGTPRTLG